MWTPDAYVRFVPLPIHVEGTTVPNPDGSCDIYINSQLSIDKQKKALKHEVSHVVNDHLYDDKKSLETKEMEADRHGNVDNCCLNFCG